MSSTVELPLWLVLAAAALASVALLNHFFLPGIRWFFRRRINRAIADANERLRLKLPSFQLTKRQVLIDRLVYDPEVMKAVETVATERAITRDGVMAEVTMYAREMVPAFNAFLYFRIGYWFARRALRSLYQVRLGFAHESALADIPQSSSVVFVINHRSNMDYLLVNYLASRDTALSYGAGEWARVWPFRALLRAAGAYIVRRNAPDQVYRKMLERYVQMATEGGVPHAIFVEGQLSRNGMVNAPKLGLLGYITRTFDPAGPRDILLVPVGTNFDRVAEERTLIANADTDFRGRSMRFVLGSTLGFVFTEIWRKLSRGRRGFGIACANFGEPLSLKQWSNANKLNLSKLDRQAFHDSVERLGGDCTQRIIAVIPVLAVPLISQLILEHERPPDKAALLAEALQMTHVLDAAGAHIGFKTERAESALAEGLALMVERALIHEDEQGRLTPVSQERALLQYYANSMVQLRSTLIGP